MNTQTIEYATQKEIDVRFSRFEEKQKFKEQLTDERQTSMEKLLNEKFATMQAIMEKNLAEHRSIANEMKAEVSDLKGDIKAFSSQVNSLQTRFGWYLTLFSIGVSVALVLFQLWR